MLTMLEAFAEQRLQDSEGAWNPGRRGGLEGKELCLGPRRLWPEHPTMGDQACNLAGVALCTSQGPCEEKHPSVQRGGTPAQAEALPGGWGT